MKISKKQAKTRLRQGEVIAVPTETVFGMAADIQNEKALLDLYNLKGRPNEKPFVIQISQFQEMVPLLSHIPFDLEKVAEHFWPGPLTLVLPVDESKVSGLVRAQLKTAAFRITTNEETRSLIEEYGPLAVTSANRSGQDALLYADCIEKEFGEDFPILESESASELKVPSTILAYMDSTWVVIRLGSLQLFELKEVLGYYPSLAKEFDPHTLEYSVRSQLHLMDRRYDGSMGVVLGFSNKEYPGAHQVIELGSLDEPQKIEPNIYTSLQKLSKENHPHIWVDMDFPKEGPLKKIAELLERSIRSGL